MKSHLCYTTFLLLFSWIHSQALEVPLYFEDAAGNRDTIVLGWDYNATSGIDAAFGEQNIIGQAVDSVFEVRISDEFWQHEQQQASTWHSKKNITGDPCDPYQIYPFPAIDLYCLNWPVIVRWDPLPLQGNACTANSVLTDMHPGGWFDVGGGSYVSCLAGADSVVIAKPDFDQWGYYWENGNDSIYTQFALIGEYHFVSMGGPGCAPVGVKNPVEALVEIGPVPVKDVLRLRSAMEIVRVEVRDLSGRNWLSQEEKGKTCQLDLSGLPVGIYLLQVGFVNGQRVRRPLIVH